MWDFLDFLDYQVWWNWYNLAHTAWINNLLLYPRSETSSQSETVSSIWNKFELLDDQIKGNVNIVVISKQLYEQYIIVGEFNAEVVQTTMKVFCDSFEFKIWLKIKHV